MTRRTLVMVALAGAVVAGGVLWLSGGEELDPQTRVRQAFDEIIEAANRQDLPGVMDRISERFQGKGMDRDGLKGTLFVQFRRGDWTRVLVTGTEVTLQSEKSADLSTDAFLARGESVIPTDADLWHFDLALEEEDDGEWRVVRADYSRRR